MHIKEPLVAMQRPAGWGVRQQEELWGGSCGGNSRKERGRVGMSAEEKERGNGFRRPAGERASHPLEKEMK